MTRTTPHCLTRNARISPRTLLVLVLAGVAGGCVQRKLSITSEPTGALVYMNDHEVGRTPIETDFTYYGKYDVQVRKDGYQTLNKGVQFKAPWWQYVPFDFFAEFMPWHPTDHQAFHFTLKPLNVEGTSTPTLLRRASEMQSQLESTRVPSTQSTTQPSTTQPSTTQPSATQPSATPQPAPAPTSQPAR